jgi:hypothetical protein
MPKSHCEIRRGLNSLTATERLSVRMAIIYVSNLSNDEISEMLNVSELAVATLLHGIRGLADDPSESVLLRALWLREHTPRDPVRWIHGYLTAKKAFFDAIVRYELALTNKAMAKAN